MPHINDLTSGVLWEGNNGDKWITGDGVQSPDKITVELKKLKVEEVIIKDEEEPLIDEQI